MEMSTSVDNEYRLFEPNHMFAFVNVQCQVTCQFIKLSKSVCSKVQSDSEEMQRYNPAD